MVFNTVPTSVIRPRTWSPSAGLTVSGANPLVVAPNTPLEITADGLPCDEGKIALHVFPKRR